jgi:hypothetical protein
VVHHLCREAVFDHFQKFGEYDTFHGSTPGITVVQRANATESILMSSPFPVAGKYPLFAVHL